METEAEQKFLQTRQEALRLSIALERFSDAALSTEWQRRYGEYLRLRIRPAMKRALEQNDADKALRLVELAAPAAETLDGLIQMASEKKQLEILDLLLRRKREGMGLKEKILSGTAGGKPEKTGAARKEWLRETGGRVWLHIRNKCSLTFPFLRVLWCRFSFTPRPGKQSAAAESGGTKEETGASGKKRQIFCGTDGRQIFYDPESLLRLFARDPRSVEGLFLHMAMHALLLHVSASPKENLRLWNLACDIAAQRLTMRIAGEEPKTEDGRQWEIRAEKLYEYLAGENLPEEQVQTLEEKYVRDSHERWRSAGASGEKELLQDVRSAVKSLRRFIGAGHEGRSDVRGNAKGGAMETLSQLSGREIAYRDFLERFATAGEELENDEESFDYIPYLFGLSYYKNMPLIEHLEYREVHKIAELVLVIDTSGSCKTETVRRFMEETYAILSDRRNFFKEMNVYILQCDFCVQDEAHITCEEEWKRYLARLVIKGRSGTDFRPAFAYVEKLRRERKLVDLKGLLYFTDGDGIYPETPTDYDTAFLLYREKESHQKIPDWAWTIRLENADQTRNRNGVEK